MLLEEILGEDWRSEFRKTRRAEEGHLCPFSAAELPCARPENIRAYEVKYRTSFR